MKARNKRCRQEIWETLFNSLVRECFETQKQCSRFSASITCCLNSRKERLQQHFRLRRKSANFSKDANCTRHSSGPMNKDFVLLRRCLSRRMNEGKGKTYNTAGTLTDKVEGKAMISQTLSTRPSVVFMIRRDSEMEGRSRCRSDIYVFKLNSSE